MRLIDADELILEIFNLRNCSNGYSDVYDKGCIIGIIEGQQTVETERKTGKWIEASPEPYVTYSSAYAECSECGEKTFLGWRMNFCPHCGKYMRGEAERREDDKGRSNINN